MRNQSVLSRLKKKQPKRINRNKQSGKKGKCRIRVWDEKEEEEEEEEEEKEMMTMDED